MKTNPTLPMYREDLGADRLDVLLVTGDAYVDHPAFGAALLGRLLESRGFRVGIVAQPRWDSPADVARLGRPRLFAGVTAGALDSMLAHYTAFRKLRRDDAYTPGGRAGARPNRATLVYTSLVRGAFPGLPVIIGGIEASLRRASHYDFWEDKLRRSILLDSKADLLAYGMAERAVLELAARLHALSAGAEINLREQDSNLARAALRGIPGTAFAVAATSVAAIDLEPRINSRPRASAGEVPPTGARVVALPSHEDILANPRLLMDATLSLERQVQEADGWTVQDSGGRRVIIAPPAAPLSSVELDELYALPFTRRPHPSYSEPIPAVEMIQFSLTTHRGCGGGCSFCSLALHQGRRIASRTAAGVAAEAERLTAHPDFRGSISDVGGPTANLFGAECGADPARCRRTSCLWPSVCRRLQPRQSELAELLQQLSRLPGVKSVRVASGIRHDLALDDPAYLHVLITGFTGGQLKLAPEHCAPETLRLMRKPSFDRFEQFLSVFEHESREAGKEQYMVPYLMSGFPGTTDADMHTLKGWLNARGWKPRQAQCFIPTPGTVATAMFFAGVDEKGRKIAVARTDAERLRQHGMLFPRAAGKRDDHARERPATHKEENHEVRGTDGDRDRGIKRHRARGGGAVRGGGREGGAGGAAERPAGTGGGRDRGRRRRGHRGPD